MKMFRFLPDDRLIGMLPPFHSFGITVTMAMPLCAGMRTVYHPKYFSHMDAIQYQEHFLALRALNGYILE